MSTKRNIAIFFPTFSTALILIALAPEARALTINFSTSVDQTAAIPGGTGNFTTLIPPDPTIPGDSCIGPDGAVGFLGSGANGQLGVYVQIPGDPCRLTADLNTAIPLGTGNFHRHERSVPHATLDGKDNLVGFQGDFAFDERMVTFQETPVQKAGLTAGNWNVSGNILPGTGTGPIRTLRISAFSLDLTPLSGSGTLFELRMTQVSRADQSTPLVWATSPEQFIFIDAGLNPQPPGNAAPGSVTLSEKGLTLSSRRATHE